jgi:hypothetical protein
MPNLFYLCLYISNYICMFDWKVYFHINPLNAKLNPICYLPALLGAHHFLHVSRIRVNFILILIFCWACIVLITFLWKTPNCCSNTPFSTHVPHPYVFTGFNQTFIDAHFRTLVSNTLNIIFVFLWNTLFPAAILSLLLLILLLHCHCFELNPGTYKHQLVQAQYYLIATSLI